MYRAIGTKELISYWKSFQWSRRPQEVHIHHTWKPNHSDFNGHNHEELQEAMRRYHVYNRFWSDIGQHLTLFPDGQWVLGRDWNRDPASIKGRNHLGFAIEIVGDFDKGHDKLQGKQLQSIVDFLRVVNLLIVFHREHASKTCPGSGIDKDWFLAQIEKPWQQAAGEKAIDVLAERGHLANPEQWKGRDLIKEPTPLWLFFEMIKRISD